MSNDQTDREAIIALIHRDRIGFWVRDAEGWADCFVPEHQPLTALRQRSTRSSLVGFEGV